MFIIDQSPTYKWTVTVIGVDELGRKKSQIFTAIFNRLPQSRLEEISKTEGISDKEIAREVLAGWEDIKTADNQEVPFSSVNLERLLDNSGIASTIVIEFMNSITGGAKRKN